MHATLRRSTLLLALAAVAACNRSDASPDGDGGTDASADAAAAADAATNAARDASPVNSVIHLVVTGGPHAGTYDAQATSGGCSYGLAKEGAWGNQYSIDTNDPGKFSSLQLVVPNSKNAAGGTKEFLITAHFGAFMGEGTDYTVDTQPASQRPRGSGTVTVEDRGGSGTVTFSAQTADGVKLEGTIECRTVMRA